MTIHEITKWLEESGYPFSFSGDEAAEVSGFASLSNCEAGKLTWIKKKENYDQLPDRSTVTIAVVQSGISPDVPNRITTEHSKEVFFAILHHFLGRKIQEGFVGEGTVIAEGAVIDPTAYIGYNCSIVGDVRVGAHTVIENNVVIQGRVSIGERCHIQSQTTIGIDGFGYSKSFVTGKKTMVDHFGGVSIGNDVFIASHVNIARGTIDDTVIENGVKIAPSTHIGHNNVIGENATIICSNMFGSVKTGSGAYISASTVQNQAAVGSNTVVGMGSVVTKSVPDNMVAFGIPAKVIKENDTGL